MMLFLEYWKQWHDIKSHLTRSLFELIKAMEETLKVVQKGNQQLSIHPLQENIIAKLMSPLEGLLHYSQAKCNVAPGDPDDMDIKIKGPLKNHIIHSLIEALDQEIAQADAGNPLKLEALASVKKVLLEQLSPSRALSPLPTPIRAIDNEVNEEDRPIYIHSEEPLDETYEIDEEAFIGHLDFRQVKTA